MESAKSIEQSLRAGLAGCPMPDLAEADAAVLIAIHTVADPAVVLTVKANHLRTHAGEVALPGGRVEASDASVIDAALREAREEVGLPADAVQVVGTLPPALSKHGLQVVPVVGVLHAPVDLAPGDSEIARVFQWPLNQLMEDRRIGMDALDRPGALLHVPAYEWQGDRIWGLTAQVLIELSNRCFGTSIELRLEYLDGRG